MTPTLLRACLAALGCSQGELARRLGCRIELVQRWAAGVEGYAVPVRVATWLHELAECVANSRTIEDWVFWRDELSKGLCCNLQRKADDGMLARRRG